MGFTAGYDNTESESKLYVTYKYPKYGEFISSLLNQPRFNKKLEIEFNTIKSSFSSKYSFVFKNIFFQRFLNNIWTLDLDLSSKKKMIRMINFDVVPSLKLIISNNSTKWPLSFSLKHGRYEASRDQIFDNYEFSQIIPSLLPYRMTSFNVSHTNNQEFALRNKNILALYKMKLGINKIHLYEANIKLSTKLKFLTTINDLKYFDVILSNESFIQHSFLFKNSAQKSPSTHINQCHVLSGYDCHSKLLGLNILVSELNHEINSGTTFMIRNNLMLRINNFEFLKGHELLSRFEPFFGIESIILPGEFNNKNKKIHNWKDYCKFIMTAGISIRLNESMTFDMMFFTHGINLAIKNENINKFRIQLDISTNI